jgi:hypothetical protein
VRHPAAAGAVGDANFVDDEAFHLNQGWQEAMHTVEQLDPRDCFAAERFQ